LIFDPFQPQAAQEVEPVAVRSRPAVGGRTSKTTETVARMGRRPAAMNAGPYEELFLPADVLKKVYQENAFKLSATDCEKSHASTSIESTEKAFTRP